MNEGTAQIREVVPAPDAMVVQRLREALELAESGELLGITVAGCLTGGEIITVWAGEQLDVWRTLGALEELKHRILRSAEGAQ